jgi:C_GCAxxG_C_C family probable redox protein
MTAKPQEVKKQAVKGFLKVFSCAHSMVNTISQHYHMPPDSKLLKAATGFAAGLSTMGDTCGMVNGGVLILGRKFSEHPLWRDKQLELILTCNQFYQMTESAAGTCNCGDVHGGKHLAKDFRRALLTGKTVKCFEMLYKGAGILSGLIGEGKKGVSPLDPVICDRVATIYREFQSQNFHCCRTTLQRVQELSGLDISPVSESVSGFIGGIGFNGSLCGAVVGAVVALGLKYGIDPSDKGYKDTLKIIYQGLRHSERIFEDEKVLAAAAVFKPSQSLYRLVQHKYSDCNCTTISGLDLSQASTVQEFMKNSRIQECRKLSETIAQETTMLL